MFSYIHKRFDQLNELVPWRNWLARGANNAKAEGSIPSGTIIFIIFPD
jgi:hypothetical protein